MKARCVLLLFVHLGEQVHNLISDLALYEAQATLQVLVNYILRTANPQHDVDFKVA
jgi:hypothetical protein